MKIYLVRHADTEATLNRLYCGFTDLSLNDEGIKRLENLKDVYQDIDKNKTIFISSGLKRCNESIGVLFGDVKYQICEELKELNFGIFEMKSYNELKDTKEYQDWLNDINNYKIPSGEASYEQEERVIRGFNNLIEEYKNSNYDLVIMCHGGSISYIVNYLSDVKKHLYEIQPKMGLGYLITFENNVYNISKIEEH